MRLRAVHGKGAVYTVITGIYDALKEPAYVSPEFDYICFTDNRELKYSIWDKRYIGNPDNRRFEEIKRCRVSGEAAYRSNLTAGNEMLVEGSERKA